MENTIKGLSSDFQNKYKCPDCEKIDQLVHLLVHMRLEHKHTRVQQLDWLKLNVYKDKKK